MAINTIDAYVNQEGRYLMTLYSESLERPERWDYTTYSIQTGERLTVGNVRKGDGLFGQVEARAEDLMNVKFDSNLYKALRKRELVPIATG